MDVPNREVFPRKHSSGSGDSYAYQVEARWNSDSPKVIAGHLLDNRWSAVRYDRASIGVPSTPDSTNVRDRHGLLSYAAAQAMRWWFVAEAAAAYGDVFLETRLIRCKVSYSFEIVDEAPVLADADSWGMCAQKSKAP